MNGGENLNLPGMLTVTDYEDEESLEDEMERNVHWRRRQSRQVNRSSISSINGGTMNMVRRLFLIALYMCDGAESHALG